LTRSLADSARIGVAAFVCGAWIPSLVSASVIPVGQSRQVSTFAFLDAVFGEEPLRSQETIESADAGSFTENAVCHVERDLSFVTALADQESTIGPDGVSATISASAEGRLAPPARGTLGIASSGLIYEFDIDVPTEVRLTASLLAEGDGVIDIAIRVRLGNDVVGWQFFDTQEDLDHRELLPPGAYQLEVGGGGEGATGPNGTGTSFISLDFAMTYPTLVGVSTPVAPVTQPAVFPNPARDAATLSLPGLIEGSVRVFSPAGRLVRELDASSGKRISWDTRDANGVAVPAGIYFLRWAGGPGTSVTIFR
jgi:hypothetical protein